MKVAKQYINYSYPVLKSNDTVDDALLLAEDFKIKELPLIVEGKLLGFYNEDILQNYGADLIIGDIPSLNPSPIVLENDPLLEILKKSHSSEYGILAVDDDAGQYVGVIETLEIYKSFIDSLALYDEGALLEIKIKNNDYSLTDISRIIEAESAKIISLFVTNHEFNEIILSLKVDKNNITTIVPALERFNYEVLSYHSSEQIDNLEKDRFDLLMKYLSI